METGKRGTSQRDFPVAPQIQTSVSALPVSPLRFPSEGVGRREEVGGGGMRGFQSKKEELMAQYPKEPSVYPSALVGSRKSSRVGFLHG